jgi:hypothetical protein
MIGVFSVAWETEIGAVVSAVEVLYGPSWKVGRCLVPT